MNTRPARPTTTALHTVGQHAVNVAGRLAAHHGAGTHWHVWRLLVGALVIVAAAYAFVCVVTPFARCRRCEGSGKFRKPVGRTWHPCKRCHGSGHRLRWGRHVSNYLHRTRTHATRATNQRDRLTGRSPR